MHKNFTKRVQEVVGIANRIAHEYEMDYVGTEHILLAIVREGTGLAWQLLKDKGVTEARLKEEIDRLMKKSMEDTWVFGRLPGTPHYRNVVALAIQQAEKMGAENIGTEHMLLALLKEEGSVAHGALMALNCDFDEIHQAIVNHKS